MSVYKRADAETYSYDFHLRGHRFSGNTEARNKKDAGTVERQLKARAKADLDEGKRTGNGPLLLRHAAGRYWEEVGSIIATAQVRGTRLTYSRNISAPTSA